MADQASGVTFHDLSQGGAAGQLIRQKDWSDTRLGPRERWPRSLTNYLSMILELPTAAIIFWGPEQIQLYNDGYSVIMGPRHPRHLGSTFRDCWPEAYDTIHPWMLRVLEKGHTVAVHRTLVPLARFGFTDESYFTFSFSPLRDDEGQIAGVLQLVTEVTDSVLAERRTEALHELSNQTARAQSTQDAAQFATRVLAQCTADLPFALIYASERVDREGLVLSSATGLPRGQQPFPAEIDCRAGADPVFPEVLRAVNERAIVPIDELQSRFGALHLKPWPEPVVRAAACPISASDQSVAGVLVAGLSPRLPFDDKYRRFVELVAAHLATLLAAAELQEARRRWIRDLERTNRELESFSYSVSHDLRAPLRSIHGFAQALRDDSAAKLAPPELEHLERIQANAVRMSVLIEALLELGKVSRTQVTAVSVNLSELARDVIADLQRAHPERTVEVKIADGLKVEADRALLSVAVTNLLSNAWKFTARRADARLELGRQAGTPPVFFVRDNGAGFNSAYASRLFTPFQRLHGAKEFEGTGVGLATVQRVIERHSGRVWAEASEGEGATFYFTLS
jgi:signal transduction histidine kinase